MWRWNSHACHQRIYLSSSNCKCACFLPSSFIWIVLLVLYLKNNLEKRLHATPASYFPRTIVWSQYPLEDFSTVSWQGSQLPLSKILPCLSIKSYKNPTLNPHEKFWKFLMILNSPKFHWEVIRVHKFCRLMFNALTLYTRKFWEHLQVQLQLLEGSNLLITLPMHTNY